MPKVNINVANPDKAMKDGKSKILFGSVSPSHDGGQVTHVQVLNVR